MTNKFAMRLTSHIVPAAALCSILLLPQTAKAAATASVTKSGGYFAVSASGISDLSGNAGYIHWKIYVDGVVVDHCDYNAQSAGTTTFTWNLSEMASNNTTTPTTNDPPCHCSHPSYNAFTTGSGLHTCRFWAEFVDNNETTLLDTGTVSGTF